MHEKGQIVGAEGWRLRKLSDELNLPPLLPSYLVQPHPHAVACVRGSTFLPNGHHRFSHFSPNPWHVFLDRQQAGLGLSLLVAFIVNSDVALINLLLFGRIPVLTSKVRATSERNTTEIKTTLEVWSLFFISMELASSSPGNIRAISSVLRMR